MTSAITTQVEPSALKVAQEQPARLASAIYRAASTMAPEARTEANQLGHLFMLAAEGTIVIHALNLTGAAADLVNGTAAGLMDHPAARLVA